MKSNNRSTRAEDASLLRALATDVEQDPTYAYGTVTAEMLRRIAVRLMEDCEYEAEAVVRELVKRTPAGTDATVAFVSAGTADEVTKIRVSPQVAARIMALIERETGEQMSSSLVA